ncbi:hypothetical protein [Neptuniibacter sp.]|uniref:hypothetical protein n=1 Tax=Neptuniibacter sp. TaxID=1962643 RepID=UPI0026067C83|nr:hypothetical protein [Neptuniibacter sp.]MCP4597567.1 hypothetical protein [Neptuniibacter sp.]
MKLLFAFATCLLLTTSLQAENLVVGVHSNYVNEHFQIAADKEGYQTVLDVDDCPPLHSEELKNIQRITMDIMLICHALKESGIANKIELVAYPNVERGLQMSLSGSTDMVAQTLFLSDHPEYNNMLITDPVIRQGEFQVGVFTTRNRSDILSKRELSEFQKLRAVTVKSWKTDQKAMKNLNIQQVLTLPTRELLSKFIANNRADFTFSYLKEPIVTRIGGELIRIPNVKVSFPDTRSFFIPKRNHALHNAMQKQLRNLRALNPDALRAAYLHAGFITEEYESWKDLSTSRIP